jgi:hypothetical protein
VVWCGVVWCGVVWCGVVWCGSRINRKTQTMDNRSPSHGPFIV